jgi:cathepsin F
MEKFQKSYKSMDEMTRRYNIFKSNMDNLHLAEKKTSVDEDELTYGETIFSDLTPEEFERQYLTLNTTEEIPKDAKAVYTNNTETGTGRFLQEDLPTNFDWRTRGAVTPVKNQGYCGGCWAFATIENIESAYFLKYGKLPILSPQQLIDCDGSNSGCNGGLMHQAYPYIQQWGLQSAETYPYQWQQGYCSYDFNAPKYYISGYVYAGTNDEERIKHMLYNYGPLAITINARLLQYYTGGVINVDYDMCPYAPNHGVVLVGWGTTARGLDYWIVRNTYGANWGENGYFRIARGRGLCGVNQYVVSAVIR